jgi:HAD superfamily hydrolase (TIGR01484 family)
MKPLAQFPAADRARIRYVLTDIDDTLTTEGTLTADAYTALERLRDAGLVVAPITGRPAGWCDHIARMWPADAVVGENGAFYFRYDRVAKRMQRRYWMSESERKESRLKLNKLAASIPVSVPGSAIASDQAYREADLAIDFCEDVPALPPAAIDRIVAAFTDVGAHAKVSSIHVNGWFGDYDKLAMTRRLFAEVWNVDLDAIKDQVVFAGDSPNDEPMFRYFPNAVGVANVAAFLPRIKSPPAWITAKPTGAGFAELADALLAARR